MPETDPQIADLQDSRLRASEDAQPDARGWP